MPLTRFSDRRVYRSSIHIHLGASKTRNGNNGAVEVHIDPSSKAAHQAKEVGKVPEFVIKPKRQFINDGETARFKASFDGPPSTTLSWSFNGKTIMGDNKYKLFEANECHHLHITMATAADQGIYTCILESLAGSTSASAELEVLVKPKSTADKSSRFVAPEVDIPLEDKEFPDKTKDATLVCKFHNALDGRTIWYKDGKEVAKWQAKTSFDGRTATLVISDVSKRTCGDYECVVKNSGGQTKSECSVSLLDPSVKPTAPKFTVPLTNQTVQSGESLVFVTKVTGTPRPSLKWYRDNKELGPSPGVSMEYQGGEGRLTLTEVTQGSKVTCVAKNIAGEDQTQAVLTVSDTDDLKEPAIFTRELHDMEAKDGDRVEMSVEVKGTQPIDIVWVHNNREIPPTDPVCRMVVDGNVHRLVIPEVFPEDAGEYVCEAYNDYGDTDTFCRLNVQEAKDDDNDDDDLDLPDRVPEFVHRPPPQLTITAGTSAILTCEVDGEPLPSVQWFCGSTKLRHGSKYKTTSVGEQHTLVITSVTADDSGKYTCTLANPVGKVSAVSVVTIITDRIPTSHRTLDAPANASALKTSAAVLNSSASVPSPSAQILNSRAAVLKSSASVPCPNSPVQNSSAPVLKSSASVPCPSSPVLNSNAPVLKSSVSVPCPSSPVLSSNAPVLKSSASVPCSSSHVLNSSAPVLNSNASIQSPSAAALKPSLSLIVSDKTLNVPTSDSSVTSVSLDSNSSVTNTRLHANEPVHARAFVPIASAPGTHSTSTKSSLNGHTQPAKTSVDVPITDYRSVLRGRSRNKDTPNSKSINSASLHNSEEHRLIKTDLKPADSKSSVTSALSSDKFSVDSGFTSAKSSTASALSADSSVLSDKSATASKFLNRTDASILVPITKSNTSDAVSDNKSSTSSEASLSKFGRRSKSAYRSDTNSDSSVKVAARLNAPSVDVAKTVEKKPGANQVDFRSVLKNKSGGAKTTEVISKSLPSADFLTGHSSIRIGSRKPEKQLTLSQKRELFEADKSDKSHSNSITNGKRNEPVKGANLNKVKQKFEQKPTNDVPVKDFRSVLKESKRDNQNNPTSQFSQSVPASVSGVTSGRAGLKLDLPVKSKSEEIYKQDIGYKASCESQPTTYNAKPFAKSGESSVNKLVSRLAASEDSGRVKSLSDRSVPKLGQKMGDTATHTAVMKPEVLKTLDMLNDITVSKLVNEADEIEEEAVEEKPEVNKALGNLCVESGSQVTLECEMMGPGNTEVSWRVNEKIIKPSKFFQMSYRDSVARLVISEAFSEDEGEYTCTATNSGGFATTACRLQVQERPSTPESTETELDEPFSPTATPPKIYNVSPTEFCILRGSSIEFKASYTSVPQGTITWSRNKQNLASGGRIKIETTDHFSTLTLSDVHPTDSGRYNILVTNDLGTDAGFTSLTVQDVPEPPVGLPCVSEVCETSVTLSWSGPAYDGGCPVTNYRVELCDAEDDEWIPVISSCVHTSCQINNLTPHTPYFFRVYAENKHGMSQPCQTIDVTVTIPRRPSLHRLQSTESDDVFTHETNDVCTPMSTYHLVSPLSPDEIPFEHRAVTFTPGSVFEDNYKTQEEIGRGKFGCVYKCIEKSTGTVWAAKVLKCREADKQKIRQEVEIMNQLQHPKILLLWDVFEAPRKIILVMEYVGGGELFERVLDDDFDLLERDCIQFLRQIVDAVHYMHGCNILHLDLKPENILCVKNESNKVKIIDFGLARFYKPGESVRVLFGTPEFIAPEVVNYDEIGFTTDMWSIGVICYVLLTGLSPFMGDSDSETLSNVTQGEYDFDDESFEAVSDEGKEFIERLLIKNKRKRMMSEEALKHQWLAPDTARLKSRRINTNNLKRFMLRRRWQKTGNAIRALGRMTSLQKLTKTNLSNAYDSGAGSTSSLDSPGYQLDSPVSQRSLLGSCDLIDETDAQDHDLSDKLKVDESGGEGTHQSNPGRTNGQIITDSDQSSDAHSVDKDRDKRKKTDINANDEKLTKNSYAVEERSSAEDTTITDSRELAASVRNNIVTQSNTLESSNRHKSHRPKILKPMLDSKAFPGDAVRFDIEYDTDADCHVTWYFEDEIISPSARHSLLEPALGSRSLVIKAVCESDDGEYSCRITDDAGEEDMCSAELIVYGAI